MTNFNNFLLDLIEDENEKKRILSHYEKIKNEIDFIGELAVQFRTEWANQLKTSLENDRYKKVNRLCDSVSKLSHLSLDSLESCLKYVYFIYFIDVLAICAVISAYQTGHGPAEAFRQRYVLPEWILNYLKRASEKYNESGFLKFLYGCAVTTEISDWETVPSSQMYDFIWDDPIELIADSSRMDPENHVVKAQEKFISIIKICKNKHRELLKYECELWGKRLDLDRKHCNKDELKSFYKIKMSFNLTVLGNYYWLINNKTKSEKCLDEALRYHPCNSNAKRQQGYLKIDEDPRQAKELFEDVLAFKDAKMPRLTRIYEEIGGNSGMGLYYYEQGQYDKAIEKHNTALEIQRQKFLISKLLEIILRLDINRSRIESGKFAEATKDLRNIKNKFMVEIENNDKKKRIFMCEKIAETCNLLGIIYFKHGLYKYAEDEFLEAIKISPEFAQSYYNYGVLEYDKGKEENREKAKKLFKASVWMKPDYRDGWNALKKFEYTEMDSVSDWYRWWFYSEKKERLYEKLLRPKFSIGCCLLILLISLIASLSFVIIIASWNGGFDSFYIFGDSVIYSNDLSDIILYGLGMIALIIIILILPFIRKVEAGPVKFETASKGDRKII